MGFGSDDLTEHKRHHQAETRLQAQLAAATTTLERVQRMLDRYGSRSLVPTEYIRMALVEPARCALCTSAYAECPVHG